MLFSKSSSGYIKRKFSHTANFVEPKVQKNLAPTPNNMEEV